VLDREGRIVAINQPWLQFAKANGASRMAGLGVGVNYLEVCREAADSGDATAREALAGIQHVLQRKAPSFSIEYPCHAPDRERWYVMHVVPAAADAGMAIITHTDITQRRLAEDRLRASEERLRFVAERASLGYWHWDLGHKRLEWSLLCKRLFGVAEDEEISYRRFLSIVHPDDRGPVNDAMRAYLEGGGSRDYDIEYRIRWPNGSLRWIHSKGSGTFREGKAQRMAGFALDITARKEAESALRESEQRFRNLADHAPVMIWVTGPRGETTYRSRRWYEFTGQAPRDALAHGWLDAVHPEDRARANEAFDEASRTHTWIRLEYRLRRSDGEYRWIVDSASPRFADNGEFLGFVGSLIDITDRKNAEEALKRQAEDLEAADRRKDEFLAMLSHELRNPLAPISTAVELMAASGPINRLQHEALEIVRRQSGHMSRLVDELLDVSRITQGTVELRAETLELQDMVSAALDTVQPLLRSKRHRLTTILTREPLPVRGDATRLVQVFTNLLGNAAKYTPDGGRIEVETMRSADQAAVHVRDNGAGMDPQLLVKVFDLFAQGDRSLARSGGGLGIGLTLVRRIVQMHGGVVAAFSEGPGRGSEFVVRLPLAEMLGAAEETDEDTPSLPPQRILVVDDNVDAASSLATLLRLEGHETRIEHDGPNALAIAHKWRPDVVLLDIGLPGMNGYQVAEQLRQRGYQGRLVAVTGYGQEADRARSQDAGFDEHLVKPVDIHTLHLALAGDPEHTNKQKQAE
jgi:PAS domain S-box-containing protein